MVTGNQVELRAEILDGKNFNIIWTDNPKLVKNQDKYKNGFYCEHGILTCNALKDGSMEIDISSLCQKFMSAIGLPLHGDIFIRLKNARN